MWYAINVIIVVRNERQYNVDSYSVSLRPLHHIHLSVYYFSSILILKILKDSHLLFMVSGIAAIQIVIIVVWELLDSQIILSRALPDLVSFCD